MQIGELSQRTGISIRMLRHYEKVGLLTPLRTESGYRLYSADEEQAVRRIRILSSSGLKLETIRHLLPCVRGDQPRFDPCNHVRKILHNEVQTLNQRIAELTESQQMISAYLGSLG